MFISISSLQESLNITEDFFGADFKESDFPGLYAQHSRKPHTPRRRVTISDDPSPGKKLKAARRRSHSQSSQDEKDVSEVKEEPISPSKNRERKRSVDSPKKPKASLNITKTLSELDNKDKKKLDESSKDASMDTEDSDDDIGKNKTSMTSKNSAASKKRRMKQFRRSLLESDDESKDEMETAPQVTEKPGNEVEVGADNSNNTEKPGNEVDIDDDDDSNGNEASAIFVPPVASGSKKISEVTAHNKDRPPSEIFLKELKKFCRDAIRSGCVSLAELKEVLALRQKGKEIHITKFSHFSCGTCT